MTSMKEMPPCDVTHYRWMTAQKMTFIRRNVTDGHTELKSINEWRQEYVPSLNTQIKRFTSYLLRHCTVQPFVEVSSTNDLLAKPLCVAPERSNVKHVHC